MRIVEDQDRKGRDQIAEDLIEPPDPAGLFCPEIPVGIGRYFFYMHHFRAAPDKMITGDLQFTQDGAGYLGMIRHNDAGTIREFLLSEYGIFRKEQLHKSPYDPVQKGRLFRFVLMGEVLQSTNPRS